MATSRPDSRVAGQENNAHAAAAQDAQDFVARQRGQQAGTGGRGKQAVPDQFGDGAGESRNGRDEGGRFLLGRFVAHVVAPAAGPGRRSFAGPGRASCWICGSTHGCSLAHGRPRSQLSVAELGNALVQPHQSGGDAGVIEHRGHLVGQAAVRMVHVALGEFLGQRQQFDGRDGVQKKVQKTFQQQALGVAQCLQAAGRGRDRIRPGPPGWERTSDGGKWRPIPPAATGGRARPRPPERRPGFWARS